MMILPIISTTEPALLVVTADGEDIALEVEEALTEDVPELELAVDETGLVVVKFPELNDDTVDPPEDEEEEFVTEDEAEEKVEGGVLEDAEVEGLKLERELVLDPDCGLRTPP